MPDGRETGGVLDCSDRRTLMTHHQSWSGNEGSRCRPPLADGLAQLLLLRRPQGEGVFGGGHVGRRILGHKLCEWKMASYMHKAKIASEQGDWAAVGRALGRSLAQLVQWFACVFGPEANVLLIPTHLR